jgi:ribosome-associated translation inhibitor RaiA
VQKIEQQLRKYKEKVLGRHRTQDGKEQAVAAVGKRAT